MRLNRRTTVKLIFVFLLFFVQSCSFLCKPKEVVECELIQREFLKNMHNEPFYAKEDNQCNLVEKPDETSAQEFFIDTACTKPFAYYPQDYMTYCKNNLLPNDHTRQTIGNPKLWTHLDETAPLFKETKWTLSQGARLNLAAVDQTKKTRPFIKKVEFTQAGSCPLEMDVLKNQPDGKDLKPILFFFGGGWKAWGPGAPVSIEGTAANLTEKGYIVFAPYYRLLTHDDAPEGCNGVDGDAILSDVVDAMNWVNEYGAAYGMSSDYGIGPGKKKFAVYGQSAGGHLAGYLATNFPENIGKAVLMYPATDFKFFIDQSKTGGLYKNSYSGVKPLVVKFVNEPGVSDIRDINTDLPIVKENSFPTLINPNPDNFPDYFMVQGNADEIAPIQMTTRMCQALDPNENPDASPYKTCHSVSSCSESKSCGSKGQLRIIGLAGHSLELRCFNQDLGKIVKKMYHTDVICAPGSYDGENRVRSVLNEVYDSFLD